MSVDGYLELFTTLYGWLFYNIIWDILVTSGVALLPFIGMLIDHVTEAYQEFDGTDAARIALKKIEVDVIIAFIVITLAANPFFEFEATAIKYTPPAILGSAAPHGEITAADNTQSTFATISFAGHPGSVDVPPWWYGVSQLGAGINRAILEGIPPVLDYRNYMLAANTLRIEDPILRQQVNDFYRDCFVKARSKYYNELPTNPTITNLLATHGKDDVDWMGSRVYLNTAAYYDSIRSVKLVEPFLYDTLRDIEWSAAEGDTLPTYGKPTCQQWWSGITGIDGLKAQIVNEIGAFDGLMATYENGFANASQRRDVMIKKLLSSDQALGIVVPRGYDLSYENYVYNQDIERRIKSISSGLSIAAIGAMFGMFLDLFLRSAPMIQALLLMGIVTFLPFSLIISRYRFSILMAGAMVWFSIKFWTVIWFIVFWVDQNLVIALFPNPGALLLSTVTTDGTAYINRMVLNFITGSMYLMLPAIFTTMVSIAGFSAGRQLDSVQGSVNSRINSGGRAVAGVAKKIKR